MGDLAKGVLGGAWAMLVGWILPSALNLTVLAVLVLPHLDHVSGLAHVWSVVRSDVSLLSVAAAVLTGVVLNALQNPLYRLLEGYLLWPGWAYRRGCQRHLQSKAFLSHRLRLLRLEQREQLGPLEPDEVDQLVELRGDPRLARVTSADQLRTSAQKALLRERLSRYPVDDAQVVPTRLGNAIRRLEEYGHNRYRLDTQVLWNELSGVAPDQVRRQVELSRVNVDFFVALMYGHLAVASLAFALFFASTGAPGSLLTTAAVVCCLVPVWYRCAVSATDEWAAAVRALVNVGRKPLAVSLGLTLPLTVEEERRMWTNVCKMSRLPYHERASVLDTYRDTAAG